MPIKITPEIADTINNALATKTPVVIAYADGNGQPILSYRGSVQVTGEDQVTWWVRNADGMMAKTIEAHPRVALMYRNPETRISFQLQGRGRVVRNGAERDRIYDASPKPEQDADPQRKGVGIAVELDRLEGLAGFGPDGPIRIKMSREG
jgi:hypothetical protein